MGKGRGFKLRNEYLWMLGDLYKDTPKAVFAAVVVDLLNMYGETELIGHSGSAAEIIQTRFREEWNTLHQAGIIPQKPPKE